MSYGIMAFAVDLDQIKAVIGSKDEQLLSRLQQSLSAKLFRLVAEGEEGESLTGSTVLGQLIRGEEYDRSWYYAHVYGYVLKYLCDHFGRSLPNSEWCPMRGEWAATVDEALEKAGVPPSLFRVGSLLMHRGAPVDIPPRMISPPSATYSRLSFPNHKLLWPMQI